MAKKRSNIFELIAEAERLEEALNASFDTFNAAEQSGDKKAIAKADAVQARAVDAVVRADTAVINATPVTAAEALTQLRFLARLSGIPLSANPEAMIGRAVAVLEPVVSAP